MSTPRVFVFNNQPMMRITPSKRLFNSTTIYEVVNRGDCFVLNLQTGVFGIIKGSDYREATKNVRN
jgi:hypothetical protein